MGGARGSTRRLFAAFAVPIAVALVGVNASAEIVAPSARPLPPPLRLGDHGVASGLRNAHGRVAVRITLRRQPVLGVASRGHLQRVIAAKLTANERKALRRSATARAVARRKAAARARALHRLGRVARRAADDAGPVERAIVERGGRVLTVDPTTNTIRAEVPAGALRPLARRRDVAAITPDVKRRPLGILDSATAVGAPSFWGAGYTGGLGVNDSLPATLWVDEDVDTTHPAFHGVTWELPPGASSIQSCGAPSTIRQPSCDHGTNVASVAISQGVDGGHCPGALRCTSSDAQQLGVIHGVARVIASQGGSEPAGCNYSALAWALGIDDGGGFDCARARTGADHPAQVINQSYGTGNTTNANLVDDSALAAFGLLGVAAAGNSGPTAGSVAAPCVGYDAICVGGYDMGPNLSSSSDDTIYDWSARGPGPLGVKKPDLVAVGGTSVADESYLYDNSLWWYATGTSFAAPQVSGGAILLAGSGITDHLAQKAILIDSARQGRSTPAAAMGTQTGWQPDWGWGALDLQAALAQRTNFVSGSVPGGSARFYKATTQAAGERATLTWDMRETGYCDWYAPGCPNYNGTDHTLTNLDLVQRDAGSGAVQTSSTSAVDNVEQVRSAGAGQVVYVVRASSAVDGAPAEPFALAAKSPLTEIAAPEPTLSADLSQTRAHQGDPVTVTATLANPSSDLAGQNAEATLLIPAGVELVSGPATQTIGTLAKKGQPGDSATVSWSVRGTTDALSDLRVVATTQAYGEQLRSEADAGRLLVDSTPPATSLTAPSGDWQLTSLDVSWSATDAGAGVDHFEVESSTDGGPFSPWLGPTTQTASTYSGSYGHTYAFRARAVDALGNASDWVSSGTATLVDPYAPGANDVTYNGGSGDTGTYTTTTWTPTPSTGGAITTRTTRLAPGLRLTGASIVGRYVLVRGRLRARGTVMASTRVAEKHLHSSARARAGRFTVRLRLPGRSAPRVLVVRVRFAGNRRYAPAITRRTVRRG